MAGSNIHVKKKKPQQKKNIRFHLISGYLDLMEFRGRGLYINYLSINGQKIYHKSDSISLRHSFLWVLKKNDTVKKTFSRENWV